MKQTTDHKDQYDAAMKRVDRIIAELDEDIVLLTAKKAYMLGQREAIIRTQEDHHADYQN
jgi:hypothetical protein